MLHELSLRGAGELREAARFMPASSEASQAQDDSQSAVTSLAPPSVATTAVSLESTMHSRQRVEERQLLKRQLQAAVKHAAHMRTPARPGRNGRPTWKITHEGVTFITDETMKVAITAYRSAR